MDFEQFKKKVMRTATSVVHNDCEEHTSEISQSFAMLGEILDAVKRSTFYGCDKSDAKLSHKVEFWEMCNTRVSKLGGNLIDSKDDRGENVLKHITFGLCTESAECLEALLKANSEKDFDHVNFQEELGDLLWYITYYCHEYDMTLEDLMKKNVAKLDKRYKEKFTTDEAVNRDLEAERKELEK